MLTSEQLATVMVGTVGLVGVGIGIITFQILFNFGAQIYRLIFVWLITTSAGKFLLFGLAAWVFLCLLVVGAAVL